MSRGSPPSGASTVRSTLAELGHRAGSELRIGGIPATALVERFGSPLYAFDAAVARRRLDQVRQALGPGVDVLFACKANPSLALLQVLHAAGAGAEVASVGEIALLGAAGVQCAGNTQFAGPAKTREDHQAAVRAGVRINLESAAECERLIALLQSQPPPRPIAVGIRVNPAQQVAGSRMRMGGGGKKFGVDEDHVGALIRQIAQEPLLHFDGLHVYAGTQCFDADAWLGNARHLLELGNRLESQTGSSVDSLNFGGGFGVPCFEGDPTFDLEAAGAGLRALLDEASRPDRRHTVELGRYLVATCGVYLTRVIETKQSGDVHHVLVDGGMHQHSAAAGVGSVIRRPFPIVHATAPDGEPAGTFAISGPLCTPADELAAAQTLPATRPGDVLAVLVSGAYGLTFSNSGFLSHNTPAEVLIDEGQVRLARAAGRPDDPLRGQSGRSAPGQDVPGGDSGPPGGDSEVDPG